LLKELGISFEISFDNDDNEEYPSHLVKQEIPLFLAEKKMNRLGHLLNGRNLLITADTIVWLNDSVIGKPNSLEDARKMLGLLSGQMHTVYTGVCMASVEKRVSFFAETDVYFSDLTPEEIEYYVNRFEPLDKAGAYGVQEWIGYVGVQRINGSYFNVMGLPVQKVYCHLCNF